MRDEYEIHVEPSDLWVALECEANRAEREAFNGVAKRQRATALHLQNAVRHMTKSIKPEGVPSGSTWPYRIKTTIRLEVVPNVNPSLKPEHWRD